MFDLRPVAHVIGLLVLALVGIYASVKIVKNLTFVTQRYGEKCTTEVDGGLAAFQALLLT